jgi:uncharacterized protein (TIGR02453 family)
MGFKARRAQTGGLFSSETFRFLAELTEDNDRDWFLDNKERYEEHVREPAREFIRRLSPYVTSKVSEYFEPSDKKMGGALMRVHRDVRFSRDKRPLLNQGDFECEWGVNRPVAVSRRR